MERVSIKGVILGGVVDMGLSVVTGIITGIVFAIYTHNHAVRDEAHAGRATLHNNYWLLLLIGYLCSVLGGYVAARVAKHDELMNGAVSSWLCLLVSFISAIRVYLHLTRGYFVPSIWVHPLIMMGSTISGLAGGYLARMRSRKLATSSAKNL